MRKLSNKSSNKYKIKFNENNRQIIKKYDNEMKRNKKKLT